MTKKKILIIEDDADTATGMSVRMHANGYATVFAADGATAIAAANKEHPDLIILDLGLPAGDGFFVLENLKSLAHTAHIPVVVLTARDPAVGKQRALDMGAAAFFQKPADNAQLLEVIRKELSEKEAVETMEGGKRKILIIEDDADFRKALNIRLRAHNYEIAFASDAFTATTEARKFQPHLILLDLGLLAGDGLIVLDHFKKTAEFARIPVIIVTGRELSITEKATLLEKAFAYFLKPVDHEALLDAIRKALE